MGIAQTKAAQELITTDTEISSHRLISLLMAGLLERVSQAQLSITTGEKEDEDISIKKIKAMLNGLQASLNYEEGGEIAINLHALYDYMLDQLEAASDNEKMQKALTETSKLILEIKGGWDEITIEDTAIAC